jgi:magnesium transporter
MELLETYHEMTSSLMELHLTSVSLKLNDVMKFLTIFTTIFIPPTLLVGIYGMNFDHSVSSSNMPELTWQYGYLIILGLIVAMIAGMLMFFKRKKWL